MNKVILTAATNGNLWMRKDTPYIPLTADEIIAHGLGAIEAGASVMHIHSRDENGCQTRDPKYFVPLLNAYREKYPKVVLEMSVGAIEGRVAELLEPMLRLRPDCASFNLKSDEEETALMFELFAKYNVKPVFEVFTAEMAEKLKGYVAAGLVKAPVFVNVVFDQSECGRSFQEYAEKLLTIIGYFPEDWHWSVTRGGDSAPAIAAMAIALGGHVRTVLIRRGEISFSDKVTNAQNHGAAAAIVYDNEDSAQLITRVARLAEELNKEVATPAEARAFYGLE